MSDITIRISDIVKDKVRQARGEAYRRAVLGSDEIHTATAIVLSGRRSGRRYHVPGTRQLYTASAPGEAPAVRTGNFRNSWSAKTTAKGDSKNSKFTMSAKSNLKTRGGETLGAILERKNRPFVEPVKKMALPKIQALFRKGGYTK